MTRKEEEEEYLAAFDQLDPETKWLHYRFALRFLAELLRARAEGRPARLDTEHLLAEVKAEVDGECTVGGEA